MSCTLVERELDAYLDRELDAERTEALRDPQVLPEHTHRVDAAIASTWMKCLLARATRRAWR